jgi:hypothetical protein
MMASKSSRRCHAGLAGSALGEDGASLGDVIATDHDSRIGRQVDKAKVHVGVGQTLHDHGELARTVGHRDHEHFEFPVDGVAALAERQPRRARIPGENMDHALDLGYAFDIDAGSAQGLNQPGKLPRTVNLETDGQIASHSLGIVRSPELNQLRRRVT